MKTTGLLVLIILIFSSCSLYNKVVKKDNLISNGYYTIGSIVDGYDNKSYPVYDQKIKLSWQETKLGQREINDINKSSKGNDKLAIIDSLDIYPKALTIDIADYTSLISNLKKTYNKDVLSLVKSDPKLRFVSSLTIYFKEKEAKLIKDASALYLINPSNSIYVIEAVKKDGFKNKIYFQDGVFIKKVTKGFCWKLDYRNQPDLIDISKRCPKGTEGDIKDLEVMDKTNGLW